MSHPYQILGHMRRDRDFFAYTEDKIRVLVTDRDRVRDTPTVFLPSIEKEGALHQFEEIFSNAVDEVTVPNSVGDEVIVTYDEKTKVVSVTDNGRGMPFGKLFELAEVLNSSAKSDKDNRAYGTSTGLFGYGMKLVNFMSTYMQIKTEREGKFMHVFYDDGIRKKVEEGKSKHHGTYVEWQFDKRFFTDINITCEDLIEMIKTKAYVIPNVRIIFQGVRKNGEKVDKVFEKMKLKHFLAQYEIASPLVEGKQVSGYNSVELVFGYVEDVERPANILAYTNNMHNKEGGRHVTGMLEGIQAALKEYMDKDYLTKDDKKTLKFKSEDFRSGLVGVVSAHKIKPVFKGQFKSFLDDEDLKKLAFYTARNTIRSMDKTKLNKICSLIKTRAKYRQSLEMSAKRLKKDIKNVFSNDKIEQYIPISKHSTSKYRELIIVEGYSASGGMKSVRNAYQQAILALRGKVENMFDLAPVDAVKASKLLRHLVLIFDCENDDIRKFSLDRCEFNRICLATDADTDGDEIAAQLAMVIAVFFPDIVTAGRLYRMVPPLYEISIDGKKKFVSTMREFMTITQKNFAKKHKLFYKGVKMTNEKLLDFLVEHERYVSVLERLAKQYAISPELCELILSNHEVGFDNSTVKRWEKIIKPHFKFVSVSEGDSGQIVLEGMIDTTYNLFEGSAEFMDDAIDTYELSTDLNFYGYSIDNDRGGDSLYTVMTFFAKYNPKILTHFKGLGEMDSEDIERTMIDRTVRHSIRLTMKDIKETYEKLAIMHSKKKDYPEKRKAHMASAKFDLIELTT